MQKLALWDMKDILFVQTICENGPRDHITMQEHVCFDGQRMPTAQSSPHCARAVRSSHVTSANLNVTTSSSKYVDL